jgi:C1A family cysteine protease
MTDQERLTKLEADVKGIKDALTTHKIPGIPGNIPHVPPLVPPHVGPVVVTGTPGKRTYGFRPDLPDQRDYVFSSLNLKPTLPVSTDLRPTCSPVEDQGQLGSCTANALAGALEFLEDKDKIAMARMSRLFIYYNERALEGTVNSDSGAAIRDGIKSLSLKGCCPETDWPYNIAQFAVKPSTLCYVDGLKHLIQSYYRVQTLSDMKTCLASGFPFVFGFTVYTSFESATVAATGIVPMPMKSEKVLGGHAVLAVGYNDASQRFIVRNSWGVNWGMKGYFTIPYAYLTNSSLASDMWYISRAKAL